jgi:uncharacterized membrane-anchored protein YhcB (DUF1043 family)
MATMRARISLWLILLIGVFLLGFVPQYLKNRDLQSQLESPRKTIEELKQQLQMSELRDQASLMLIEISRQNYGLAKDHAGQYYDTLNKLIESLQNPALKKSLQDLATTRDSLTEALTTPTPPAALTAAQQIVLKTFELTKTR